MNSKCTLPFTLLTAFFVIELMAQDLTEMEPIAHYKLINTAEDSLGFNSDISLLNAPFQGDQGVFSNGIYRGIDTTGTEIETPIIDALDFDPVNARIMSNILKHCQ